MEPRNSSHYSLHEDDHRLVHGYKDGGHLRETQNQKLKRLSIDESKQTFRKSVNFSDSQPVKVTAKFEFIGATPGFTTMNIRGTYDENSRFPKIEEMAHFHYDNVDFSSPLQMCLFESNQPGKTTPEEGDSVKVKVNCRDKSWVITRTLGDFAGLDMQFHRCVYDRHFTGLESLKHVESERTVSVDLKRRLKQYIKRLSEIAGNTIWCGPILNWFEVDNKGNHLLLTEDSAINVPAVAAAHVIKRYTAQASDELSFEVGDIVSVIDMPPYEESPWWRGKHDFEVGFFPSQCVKVIGDSPTPVAPQKLTSVASKRGKVVSYLRMFLSSRPSRVKLLQSGILRERTFGCDLGEHLQRVGRDVPLVLEMCVKLIERCGITNGVYRLSGMSSNVQKIRMLFDTEESPVLEQDCFLHDIHCVGSALKMYFRELPNPLLTYHLYDKFTKAVQTKDAFDREIAVHHVVQQLPPPHYKTMECLLKHLAKVADYHEQTGMHAKNLSIVWAPNLLRQEKMDERSTLRHFGSQATVIEFLIRNVDIFFDKNTAARTITNFPPSPMHRRCRSDPTVSGLIDQDRRDKTRPASVGVSPPPKLISLEEARNSRSLSNVGHLFTTLPVKRAGRGVPIAEPESSPELSSPEEAPPPFPQVTNTKPEKNYIEVGEGPSALPEYHTVLELPGRKRQTSITRSGRKWKSLFGKRPDSGRLSSSLSSSHPPVRQQSYEEPKTPDSEKVRSKSVDELSEEASPQEKGRALFVKPITRQRFTQSISGQAASSSKSKFYVDADLPPEGTRGKFVNSGTETRQSSTAPAVNRKREISTKYRNRTPSYEQSLNIRSPSRTKSSPTTPNNDESTFFVTGRLNQQTQAKTVEVFRAPNINCLSPGRTSLSDENLL